MARPSPRPRHVVAQRPPPGAPPTASQAARNVERLLPSTLVHGATTVTINHGTTFLVSSQDGSIQTGAGEEQGLYAEDTRFLSRHDLTLNGRLLDCVATSRISYRQASWTLNAPGIPSVAGDVADVRVTVTLDRVISARQLHEDLTVRCYGSTPVKLLLSLALESDFADLFEVRTRRWQRRTQVSTVWHPPDRLDTRYVRDGFLRRCLVRITSPEREATYANGALRMPVDVAPGEEWHACLQFDLVTREGRRPALTPCPVTGAVVDRAERLRRRWHSTVARVGAADRRLELVFDRAVGDFAALRLHDLDFSPDVWLPAAGIPWFVAVFGRDSIIASLQALSLHPLFAVGTLQKLAQWQSTVEDPVRDAQPGKICHEMRVGEWAHFRTIPHTPYYGTADATPLYLVLLAEAQRWLGARALRRFRSTAEDCLDWIDRYGDGDGDGFQEYAPQAPTGYRNQCWRDAEDGVLDESGGFPPHPIGTCEMQGYVYAAWLAAADLLDGWGEAGRAAALRRRAAELRARFHEAFWLPEERTLAFALDGAKRPVRTATSNPGQCLWSGIVDPAVAGEVADRLLRPDLFSGFGLRTLSSEHPSYDPHSYQRGSVWPHDTMLAAAGLARYGRWDDAWRLIDGLLAAATAFEGAQLPELFAGLAREGADVPVPYEHANVPQAWAAGCAFQAVRLLLGLEPDVPRHRVHVAPALPPWCPTLELENVRVGAHRLHIAAHRRADGSSEARVDVAGPGPLEVIYAPAPWLAPSD